MAEPTQPVEQMVMWYFIVSDDVECSRRFYTPYGGNGVPGLRLGAKHESHSDSAADVLGHRSGVQSPSGSVVWPTSIR